MHKWATQLVAESVGMATARGRLLTDDGPIPWTGPCVVKPLRAGSSHGVTPWPGARVTSRAAVKAAFHEIL